MKLNRTLLIAFSLLILNNSQAQDTHFTQFDYVPLTINPAQTGLYEGSYRVGILYRGQWFKGVKNGYQTPVIYADIPLNGFRKQDWIGVGLNLHRDAAGDAALTNTLVGANISYHLGLDRRQENVLSFGVQVGINQRNIDKSKLIFQDGIINNGAVSQDLPLINAQNVSYTNLNFGVNFRSKVSKTSSYNLGLSLEHLLSSKYNLLTPTIAALPTRINLYGTMDVALNKRISLQPALLIRTATGSSEIMLQAVAGLKLDPKKDLTLKGGLGYRLGDALQALVGAQWDTFKVGVAYDFTLSELRTNAKTQDGFEIAIGYIGRIFRTPKPNPVILCPRY